MRKIVLFACLGAASLALAACDQTTPTPAPSPTATPTDNGTDIPDRPERPTRNCPKGDADCRNVAIP